MSTSLPSLKPMTNINCDKLGDNESSKTDARRQCSTNKTSATDSCPDVPQCCSVRCLDTTSNATTCNSVATTSNCIARSNDCLLPELRQRSRPQSVQRVWDEGDRAIAPAGGKLFQPLAVAEVSSRRGRDVDMSLAVAADDRSSSVITGRHGTLSSPGDVDGSSASPRPRLPVISETTGRERKKQSHHDNRQHVANITHCLPLLCGSFSPMIRESIQVIMRVIVLFIARVCVCVCAACCVGKHEFESFP